jgi:undecaprenyl-diphosphatase
VKLAGWELSRKDVDRFDAAVDRAFDRIRGNPVADRVFYTATELGDFSLIWLLLAAAKGLRSERDWHAGVRAVATLGVESLLVNQVIKQLFGRTRPTWDDRPRNIRRPLTSSFPSGHATSAFCAAVVLSDGDPLWPVYFALAGVVAASRVYVRIHHASDVVAGIPIGLGFGAIARRVRPLPGESLRHS